MNSSKTVYSSLIMEEKLDSKIVDEVKSIELKMLLAVDKVCEELNINYIMAYGTMLGAVRHKGFIPWDDDIDICMMRKDIPKFLEVFLCKYGQTYRLVDNGREPIYFYIIEKIGTTVFELGRDNEKLVTGVKIDIFPLDYVDSEKLDNRNQVKIKKISMIFHGFYCTLKIPEEKALFFRVV